MDRIDQFLQSLDGGTLMLRADYAQPINAYVTRIQAENVLEEAEAESDFAILTPTQCYEFAYYEPELDIIDRRDDMPVSTNPDHPDFLRSLGSRGYIDWPIRDAADITGLTIHHTLSDNPLGVFQWITRRQANGGKGYPRGQYHYWVSRGEGAPISHLLDDTIGCWHDHTGTYQTTLSIGMAGHLGHARPPEEQLLNTVRLCWHLIQKYSLTLNDVDGHTDRATGVSTVCPGWYADSATDIQSGVWRRDFDIALQCVADGREWPGYNA